jgi:hypothetical protein
MLAFIGPFMEPFLFEVVPTAGDLKTATTA